MLAFTAERHVAFTDPPLCHKFPYVIYVIGFGIDVATYELGSRWHTDKFLSDSREERRGLGRILLVGVPVRDAVYCEDDEVFGITYAHGVHAKPA